MCASNSGLHSMPSSRAGIQVFLIAYDRERRAMEDRTRRGYDIAPAGGFVSLPSGNDTAGPLDQWNEGCDIIGFKTCVHGDVDETGSQHGEEISIAAKPRHAGFLAKRL